jgi:hypothetical protein
MQRVIVKYTVAAVASILFIAIFDLILALLVSPLIAILALIAVVDERRRMQRGARGKSEAVP